MKKFKNIIFEKIKNMELNIFLSDLDNIIKGNFSKKQRDNVILNILNYSDDDIIIILKHLFDSYCNNTVIDKNIDYIFIVPQLKKFLEYIYNEPDMRELRIDIAKDWWKTISRTNRTKLKKKYNTFTNDHLSNDFLIELIWRKERW
jgi:hypothetical protein